REFAERRAARPDPRLSAYGVAAPAAELPLSAELLGLCRRGDPDARRGLRRVARAPAPPALPPVGRQRLGSGAGPGRSRFAPPLPLSATPSHGPAAYPHHRHRALDRDPARLRVFLRAAAAGPPPGAGDADTDGAGANQTRRAGRTRYGRTQRGLEAARRGARRSSARRHRYAAAERLDQFGRRPGRRSHADQLPRDHRPAEPAYRAVVARWRS